MILAQHAYTARDAVKLQERGRSGESVTLEPSWAQEWLRSARAGVRDVVTVVSGFGPDLPRVGTSPLIVDSRHQVAVPKVQVDARSAQDAAYRRALTAPVPEQLREFLAALSLSKSQLAEVLRVARPTLYEWLDGKAPSTANQERIAQLMRVMTRAGVAGPRPLNARFVRHPLRDGAPSLLALLQSETLDEPRILTAISEAQAMDQEAQARLRDKEDRLRGLGYERPSDQERREQLATNIALRDWPKIDR